MENSAVRALVSRIAPELVLAQVLIRRVENGFDLRHEADRESAPEKLRLLSETEVRTLARFTSDGAFRPLKSAPNLQSGWRRWAGDATKLEFALDCIYPGAIADWFAVQSGNGAPTPYREFTNRQTGMYRITAMLSDDQAAPMIRACCHRKFCLKQRRWTVDGLPPDSLCDKSVVPCLQPCALLLEFARKAMRLIQQEEKGESAKVDTLEAAGIREADFENPMNPRRLQWALETKKN
ncbi:MAG: DR2241 family protein [Verrucomicrobiota bacterium]